MKDHNPYLWKREKPYLQSDFLMRKYFPIWLGNVEDLIVLDACCGEGYVSRMLARKGAHVIAFDRDPEMIKLAQSVNSPSGIDYKVGEMHDVKDMCTDNSIDIVVWSWMPPLFNETELYKSIEGLTDILKPKGRILVTNLHTDAYFKRANSNWMVFTSEGNPNLETQEGSLNFYTPDGELAFSGHSYFHTPAQMRRLIRQAGLEVVQEYAPLATREDTFHFPHMWRDEVSIPFHHAVIAMKR